MRTFIIKIERFLYCFALFFILTPVAEGGQGWRKVGLEGYNVGSLVLSPDFNIDHTMFAFVSTPDHLVSEGVFKSDNGGQTWAPKNNGLQPGYVSLYYDSLAISPNFISDRTLFVVMPWIGLYRSTDAAESWQLVLQYLYNSQVCFSPAYASDRTIFLGDYNLIMKSTDGGTTWQTIDVNLDPYSFTVTDFAFSPMYALDQTLFVGLNVSSIYSGGVLKSTDGGLTYNFVSIPRKVWAVTVSTNFAEDMTVFVGTEATDGSNHLMKSTDGGVTYQPSSSGIPITDVQEIIVSPSYNTDQTVYAATGGDGFFRSTNGGISWQPFMNGMTCGWSSTLAIAVDNNRNIQHVFAGVYMGSCSTVWEDGVWGYKY